MPAARTTCARIEREFPIGRTQHRAESTLKLNAISATDVMPVRKFEVTGLSDVVVLAGANGVGKTRLLEWLIGFFRTLPSRPDQWLIVEATSKAALRYQAY